jgi:acyl-CoA thioester hydrolase
MSPRLANKMAGLGHFDGKTHVLPLRAYYEDTDLSGVIYHANYLRYMERGRTEFFRMAGISKIDGLEKEEPTAWALRHAEIKFLRAGRMDDALFVHTRLIGLSGARLLARQQIYAANLLLTNGRIEACVITLTGKPRRIPQDIRELLTPFLYESDT